MLSSSATATNIANESADREWAERIGRERFEFLFRSSLRVVAGIYVQFLTRLAKPLFDLLKREHGMVPGFEATAALKYNPYPDPRYRITFDDLFWHLDKESTEETFDRLLERHTYAGLKSFLQGYFEDERDALAAVCKDMTFPALLKRNGGVLLKADEVIQPNQLRCHYKAGWGTPFAPADFEVYTGGRVRCKENSDRMLADAFADFRKCFFEERKRQRKAS